MTKRKSLSDYSIKQQKQIAAQLDRAPKPLPAKPAAKRKPRRNAEEAAWAIRLQAAKRDYRIESWEFIGKQRGYIHLCEKCSYTPDFAVRPVGLLGLDPLCYIEVKGARNLSGSVQRDSYVRMKFASVVRDSIFVWAIKGKKIEFWKNGARIDKPDWWRI